MILIPDTKVLVTVVLTSKTFFQSRPKVFKAYETNKEMLAQTLPIAKALFKKGDLVEIIGRVVSENKVDADFINLLLDK